MLSRLFGFRKRDPMWDHFIHRAPADPNGNLVPTLTQASEGRVFPVKDNDPDPGVMARKIKDLALWWGADLVGIASLTPGQASLETASAPSDDASKQSGNAESPRYRYAVVFVLFSDHNPKEAQGIGGQYVLQRGAVVVQHMGAYIREIGFQATKSNLDPIPLAEAAGLGKLERRGELKVRGRRQHAHVPHAVVTDLPLAADVESPDSLRK